MGDVKTRTERLKGERVRAEKIKQKNTHTQKLEFILRLELAPLARNTYFCITLALLQLLERLLYALVSLFG